MNHPHAARTTTPPTILVVDDEESVCALLRRTLTQAGYAVETAANGLEALVCLKHTPFALIICDVLMPLMDGLALCMRVRAEPAWARIPIIVMSGAADFAAFPPELANAVLGKPITLADLLTCVANLIAAAPRSPAGAGPSMPGPAAQGTV